jgi:hypothetical protein
MIKKRRDTDCLTVKVAGGATAQCLALMNAIYVKNKTLKTFRIKYFPYSTGTYWPFEIDFLLSKAERVSEFGETKGFNAVENSENLTVGKIIDKHPLQSKFLNYEKVLVIIRKLGLESKLLNLRGEIAIIASKSNLDRVTEKAKAISGGYAAIVDSHVNAEMDFRFKRAGFNSPFSLAAAPIQKNRIAIHLRIGDKRATFTNPLVGRDGITDPRVFKEILENLELSSDHEIFVISDEPEVARDLLKTVGISAKLNPDKGNIWDDLYFMSQSAVFIGSWSQVSQLAAVCVLSNGGKAFCPSSNLIGDKSAWQIDGVDYYHPQFLDQSHKIYET